MEKITNRVVIFAILILLTLLMGFIDNVWYARALVVIISIWWVFFVFSKKYQVWQDLNFNWFKDVFRRSDNKI